MGKFLTYENQPNSKLIINYNIIIRKIMISIKYFIIKIFIPQSNMWLKALLFHFFLDHSLSQALHLITKNIN